MTEAEWLACDDATPMLAYVQQAASERRLLLLACACCEQARPYYGDTAGSVVRFMGLSADGVAGVRPLAEFDWELAPVHPVDAVFYSVMTLNGRGFFAEAVRSLDRWVDECVRADAESLKVPVSRMGGWETKAVVRCIMGNPFRPVAFDPAWRTSTVVALADQMDQSRDFGAAPILADALQDAGCDVPDILDHCRGDGPHVRGCWVIDFVLHER
jgi:hypothetical protein